MRKIREVLRLKFEVGLSARQVAFVSSAGNSSVADPSNINSQGSPKHTSSRLTWMTVAPAAKAISGISAAGLTIPEVPTDIKTSQSLILSIAVFQTPFGRSSPNQTTPGRRRPLQRRQRGGSISSPSKEIAACWLVNSAGRLHAKPIGQARLPWRCTTSRDPARSCNSSIF